MTQKSLKIELLGPLEVRLHDEAVSFRTDAIRALLVVLACQPGSTLRRDSLAALLSPERPDAEALTYLRNCLTRLRASLHDDEAARPWLLANRKEIGLRADARLEVDLVQFERHLAAVEAHPHRRLAGCAPCLAELQGAVALVRGEFVAGLSVPSDAWEEWLTGQRAYYRQRALGAMSALVAAWEERGAWDAVLEVAQRQLQLEPWLETAHRAIMRAHYQMGARTAALAQFAACATLLWDELAVEPEPESQQLRQQILAGTLAAGHAPLGDNLPKQVGNFVGREGTLDQVLRLLTDPAHRLVTLVGPGGIGKSRLAVEAAGHLKASFPDGVCFVSLEGLEGGSTQLQSAIGERLGLGQAEQRSNEQLLALLRAKQLLLILDNCEELLAELSFVAEWLRRAPHLAILATSREPLDFQAETVVPLRGLPTEGQAGQAAERLFVERGQMARSDFAPTAQERGLVRRICALVDGSPLGIALAAGWVRRRSLAQIVSSIGESLDFLSTRQRDVEPRHRSVRALFDTSWQLLDAAEQALLAALALFPASFTAEAAAAVAGATLHRLDQLCEKSLLQQQYEAERYQMHGLLRQFAAEKLAQQAEQAQRAFVHYFLALARSRQHDYAALQPEWGNLAAAIRYAHALALAPQLLEFVTTLDEAWFRQIRFYDMRAALALALDAATALPSADEQGWLLLRLGEIELEQNAYPAAEEHLARALALYTPQGNSVGRARATYLLGRLHVEQSQDEKAGQLLQQARQLFEELGDDAGVAKTLNIIALCHIKGQRDFEAARACLHEAAARQHGSTPSTTHVETLRHLARVQGWAAEHDAAEATLGEAARISQQLSDVGEFAAVLYEQTLLCKRRAQWERALSFGYECLEQFSSLGSLRWEGLVKTQLALAHQAQGELAVALALLREGLHLFQEVGDVYEEAYSHYYLSLLYATLGDATQSQQARQQARQLNLQIGDPQLHQRLA